MAIASFGVVLPPCYPLVQSLNSNGGKNLAVIRWAVVTTKLHQRNQRQEAINLIAFVLQKVMRILAAM